MFVKGNQVYGVYHKSHRSTVRISDEGPGRSKVAKTRSKSQSMQNSLTQVPFFFFLPNYLSINFGPPHLKSLSISPKTQHRQNQTSLPKTATQNSQAILNPTSTPSTPPYGHNPHSQLTSPFKSAPPSSHRHGNAHLFPNSTGTLKY
jgi:hypothetical protein